MTQSSYLLVFILMSIYVIHLFTLIRSIRRMQFEAIKDMLDFAAVEEDSFGPISISIWLS